MKFFCKNKIIGLDLFNRKYTKYGGHSQWISYIFFHYIDYLIFSLNFNFTKPLFMYYNEYYDGYNHEIRLLIFQICWGGFPYFRD